jgi:hypothetical protein
MPEREINFISSTWHCGNMSLKSSSNLGKTFLQTWRLYYLIKSTLYALEYIHNRSTKSPSACFGTSWMPFSGSLHSSLSSAFEMVRSVQHSHTHAHVLELQLTHRRSNSHKMLKHIFKLNMCSEEGYYDFTLRTVHAIIK